MEQPLILGIESSCRRDGGCRHSGKRTALRRNYFFCGRAGIVRRRRARNCFPCAYERRGRSGETGIKQRTRRKRGVVGDCRDVRSGASRALLVGLSFAKGLAYGLGIPLIGVNHIRGHLSAAYLEDSELEPPFVTLLASGGHTAVLYTESKTKFCLMGGTLDDAAGEAFDKVARILSLPYPGGPHIERLAKEGSNCILLPQMLKGEGGYNFSYSGLKTAVINYCHTQEQRNEAWSKADVAASFQSAALDILVKKTVEAAREKHVKTVTAGGGVIANGYLRERLTKACRDAGLKLVLPVRKHCTDNAAMIAAEGLIQYESGNFSPLVAQCESEHPSLTGTLVFYSAKLDAILQIATV